MDTIMETEKIGMQYLRDMVIKQEYKCAISGRILTPDNCSLDHIVPLSRGGMHLKSNAQLVCLEVNKAKGSMTEDEFVSLCKDVVTYHNA